MDKELKRLYFADVIVSSSCWGWSGSKEPNGYGSLRYKGRRYSTHRLSWMIHRGPIPEDLCVCHTCDNRICSNPKHLFLGTKSDNALDAVKKNRHARGSINGQAKLNEETVTAIFKNAHKSRRELATQFSVSPSCIQWILKREAWKHVPVPKGNRLAEKTIANSTKTHCPQGHPYNGENLLTRCGSRYCRECDLARKRLTYRREVEAAHAAL